MGGHGVSVLGAGVRDKDGVFERCVRFTPGGEAGPDESQVDCDAAAPARLVFPVRRSRKACQSGREPCQNERENQTAPCWTLARKASSRRGLSGNTSKEASPPSLSAASLAG